MKVRDLSGGRRIKEGRNMTAFSDNWSFGYG
jgi:hypothetical protein